MSELLAIYDALAAVQVPVDGAIVRVKNVTELPESVAAADCPVRLLMPWGERTGTSAMSVISLGGMSQAEWQIVDLLLLRPAQADKLKTAAAAVVRYMRDYSIALARTRTLAGAVILNPVKLTSGVGEYPKGGPAWFGVEASLTVRETWR